LPRFLSKLSKNNTPYWAIIFSSGLMTILLGMNYSALLTSQFTLLITMSNLCVLIPYLYTMLAAMRIIKKSEKTGAMLMALLACVYILFAIIGSGKDVISYGIVLLLILTPLYAFASPKN
jgi:APA family basic amino acid/polyamine antiporter